MNRRLLSVLCCAGLATGLLSTNAFAQSGGLYDEIDAVFVDPSAYSTMNAIGFNESAAPYPTGYQTTSPAAYIEGAGHSCDDACDSLGSCDATDVCDTTLAGSCDACDDDCWTRQHLTGDMWGARSCLAEHGILADVQLTQFYQGVASGGREQTFEYGGKVDYIFTVDGSKFGHEGFTTILHAETQYGQSINPVAGAFAFPNTSMLYPLPGTHETAITGLIFQQALSESFALTAGKFNLLDLWSMLYPNTGRGITGFMNLSLIAPVPIIRTTNLSVNGAGAMVLEGQQIQGALMVYDTNNSSTTVGLDNLFDDGAVVLGYWRIFTDLGGRPGSHAVLGNWSSRSYTSVDPSSWTVVPGQGLVVGSETGSWTLSYILDQVLWADPCHPTRNVNLMSQWMIADGNPNFYKWSGNVALQASGVMPGRELDTMGAGYFYDGLSNNFQRLVSPVVNLQDVHGAELYYNAAVTPWFRLTTDLQVIDNANVNQDTVIAVGLRANIDI